MKVSLGPLLYCWEKEKVTDFYQQVNESNIELVYIGEAVCSRRRLVKLGDYLAIAKMLANNGKQVVLTTLTLIEAASELTELKKWVDNGDFLIEANDIAAINIAKEHNLPFVCGASINNYNRASLDKLHQWGMQRFVMPVELSADWVSKVAQPKPPFEIEVTGYGYLPLAHSARCFTARNQQLTKDKCNTICVNHSKGLLIQTQENQPLLRINGIQTQSASCCDLRPEIANMQQLGVDWFRVLPNSLDSINVANDLAMGIVPSELTTDACNGYWHGLPGFQTQ